MKKGYLLFALMVFFVAISHSQTSAKTQEYNISKSHLAIDGYDPVAYFTNRKAVKGNKQHQLCHQGVVYYFSSAANKSAFEGNPAKYEPQYGGWCAYAMGATGEKVEIDPETFKITDGKLFLFYNSLFKNTLPLWNKDEQQLKSKADKNWSKFVANK